MFSKNLYSVTTRQLELVCSRPVSHEKDLRDYRRTGIHAVRTLTQTRSALCKSAHLFLCGKVTENAKERYRVQAPPRVYQTQAELRKKGEEQRGARIGFRAEQCIIVRDHFACNSASTPVETAAFCDRRD